MDTRKVQKLGKSTLAMTLPAKWTKNNHVKKGDNMIIEPSGHGVLTVAPESIQTNSGIKATIYAQELNHMSLERIIIGQYVLGRQVISIENDSGLTSEQIGAVYDAEKKLMGLGVIEETKQKISIRCSIGPDDFNINNMIERLENTGSTMRGEAIKSLINGDTELAHRVIDREKQANKIFILLLRIIFTSFQNPRQIRAIGLENGLPLISYRSIAKNLELAADNAESISKEIIKFEGEKLDVDKQTIKNISDFSVQVDELSKLAIDTVVKQKYELYNECTVKYTDIQTSKEDLLQNIPELDNEELLRVRQVIINLFQTTEYSIRNAEIALNFILNNDSEYVKIN